MLAEFVNDQAAARHDVEHAVNEGLRHEGAARGAAVAWVALLVLRPQAVQHE